MKTLKILKFVFLLFFTLQLGSGPILAALPLTAQAADNYSPLIYTPQIKIPVTGSELNKDSTPVGSYNATKGVMTSDLLAKYIKAIYDYGMMICGILAAIVLMGGGVLWLISAGDSSKVSQAKELITGSLTGMVILFSSWIILNTINPDLLKLKLITTQVVRPQVLTNIDCQWRCITAGNKCEGGGGHDTIAATSPWRSTDLATCEKAIGQMPTSTCPITQLYDCCCQTKTNVANEEEAKKLVACLKGDGKPQPEYTSCHVGNVKGYCKTIEDSQGGANKTECMTCLKVGDKCRNNVGDGDSECANEAGLCGSSQHGDCNANPTDGSWSAQTLASLEASLVTCNKVNSFAPYFFSWLTGSLETYIECKCK